MILLNPNGLPDSCVIKNQHVWSPSPSRSALQQPAGMKFVHHQEPNKHPTHGYTSMEIMKGKCFGGFFELMIYQY